VFENLIPIKRHQEDEGHCTSVHHALASDPPSEYSSSVYSKCSSGLAVTKSGETAMSSFPTDDVLMPEPLDLRRATSMELVEYTPRIIGDPRSSEVEKKSCVTVAILPGSSGPKSEKQPRTSSDSESDVLVKDIVRYPMVEASPTYRLAQIPSPSANIFVNQKAARLLGLDGAGYVSQRSEYLGCVDFV
jgi:hypothetical protein